jgi:adenylyl-sulfate kinase
MPNEHVGGIIWLTGLPGSGKTTLARGTAATLRRDGYHVYVLDGDSLRTGLNADLGFSEAERRESVRRAGEVACLFADAGILCIVALISPYEQGRQAVRERAPRQFFEVYVATPLGVCEARDPKGMYRRARTGELPDFTGVSSPYEPPAHPELVIDTSDQSPDVSIGLILDLVRAKFPPAMRKPNLACAPVSRTSLQSS